MCRSCEDGGRRCVDRSAARATDLVDLEPAAAGDDIPAINWEPRVSTGDLYQRFGDEIASATIVELQRAHEIEPKVTAEIVAAKPEGTRMHGLEFRMKSPKSLASKIENKLAIAAARPGTNVRSIVSKLTDFIRYTVISPNQDRLVSDARATVSNLQSEGWEVKEVEHSFVEGNPYKGIHVIITRPDSGGSQDIEVQFHSEAGIAVKDQYHIDYEVMRDQEQGLRARAAAYEKMAAAWSTISQPAGIDDLEVGGVHAVAKKYPPPPRPKMN